MFQFAYKQSENKRIALPVKNQSGKKLIWSEFW